jgi:hypothetical protein
MSRRVLKAVCDPRYAGQHQHDLGVQTTAGLALSFIVNGHATPLPLPDAVNCLALSE